MNLPLELMAVFRRHADAKTKFERLSPSHQREHVIYITTAKQADTRVRRADKVVMMLTGKKLASVYKPKTIPDVFGLKLDMKTRVINQPRDYKQIMSGWSYTHPVSDNKNPIDFAHLFIKTQIELIKWLPVLKAQLEPDGMIWASWLKGTSGIKTDVNENTIRDFALSIGLVDIKVCAVSDIWSGLKLVIPRSDRYNSKHK